MQMNGRAQKAAKAQIVTERLRVSATCMFFPASLPKLTVDDIADAKCDTCTYGIDFVVDLFKAGTQDEIDLMHLLNDVCNLIPIQSSKTAVQFFYALVADTDVYHRLIKSTIHFNQWLHQANFLQFSQMSQFALSSY